jgi:ribosomal protein L32
MVTREHIFFLTVNQERENADVAIFLVWNHLRICLAKDYTMIQSLTKCINCGIDKVGHELCPLCGVSYARAEKVFFEELKEELKKEGHENLATGLKTEEESPKPFEFGNSPIDLVIIGIVLLLGIVVLYWSLGYLN